MKKKFKILYYSIPSYTTIISCILSKIKSYIFLKYYYFTLELCFQLDNIVIDRDITLLYDCVQS